jgi:hypothetical protein
MDITGRSASEVIAEVELEGRRQLMETLDAHIRQAMPDRQVDVWEGRMWGGTEQRIIGYGRIVQAEQVRWFLVGLAAQSRHVSVYANAVVDGGYALSRFADALGAVKVGSANIRIRRLEDLQLEAFIELLQTCDRSAPPDAW